MEILNAMQLKNGAKADRNKMGTLTQPVQFIPFKEKDEEWTAWNMDWLEWNGIKQIRRNAPRLVKNYKLARGIIDKADYILEEDNEYKDIMDVLTQEDSSALELKFYPIIPNVINVLVDEFAKRASKITFRSVDEYSYNELFEQKRSMIEQNLMANAQQKLLEAMLEAGLDPETEEAQQQMSPENLKSLPEIEQFMRKDYRNIPEQWAVHQHEVDQERFHMDELEQRGFSDYLITDREFWHFRMMEDDYDVELWNPVTTFYHKSPETRYISQGNFVGKIEMMSPADVIDKYGWIMDEDQLLSLERNYPVRSAAYPITGYQNDGTFYDPSRSHKWNTEPPSLQMRQLNSMYEGAMFPEGDIMNWILGDSEDYFDIGSAFLLRVTTSYWKSQRKVGHLVKIDDTGYTTVDIVDESYKVTDKPVHDTSLFKVKDRNNLVFGEYIEWIYVNEVWGGVKIGPNHPSFFGMDNPSGAAPMYLGIMSKKPGRMKFQFKGDHTLYGCKLPVEGAVFSDRNTRSTSLVDSMKPFQVSYNLVNNQIADILVDELGTIILLDQNALPRHSLGEDWGKGNYAKAYVAMKNFSILPLDTSLTNTENATNFQYFQQLNLEQSARLLSRVNLANYFKQQAFEVIGLTPQRLGQQIGQTPSATGVEQAVAGSYAQTETYFIQHCDHLMPRVHEMRTDLAQYYQSRKASVRLQYITTADEKMNFQINGTELLLREFNVFPSTNVNHRNILEKLKSVAEQNNTTGSSIFDLGRIMQAESMSELDGALRAIEDKLNKQAEVQRQHEIQLQQDKINAEAAEKAAARDAQAQEAEKDRRKDLLVAEIRASGYLAMKDFDGNQQSDFQDQMQELQKTSAFQESMGLQREKTNNQMIQHNDKMSIAREKIAAERDRSEKALRVAIENKPNEKSKKK